MNKLAPFPLSYTFIFWEASVTQFPFEFRAFNLESVILAQRKRFSTKSLHLGKDIAFPFASLGFSYLQIRDAQQSLSLSSFES